MSSQADKDDLLRVCAELGPYALSARKNTVPAIRREMTRRLAALQLERAAAAAALSAARALVSEVKRVLLVAPIAASDPLWPALEAAERALEVLAAVPAVSARAKLHADG